MQCVLFKHSLLNKGHIFLHAYMTKTCGQTLIPLYCILYTICLCMRTFFICVHHEDPWAEDVGDTKGRESGECIDADMSTKRYQRAKKRFKLCHLFTKCL